MRLQLSLICYVAWWMHAAYAKDCAGSLDKKGLKLLKKLDPIKGKKFTANDDDSEYKYTFGICTSVLSDKGDEMVGAMQEKIDKKDSLVRLGLYNETQITGGNNWIFLKYKGGKNYSSHCDGTSRQAHLMIICDHDSSDTKLRVIEEHKENITDGDSCYYLFELSTPVICVVPPQEALSGGSIFCIIFFTVLGIYLIIGFLYQRIVVGAKGLEQIPNYNFWKDFGQLQADGCDFVCRCGERQDAKMYRGIDDQLLNPEPRDDRDDRLLPM